MPFIVALSGTDGSGKTALGQLLSRRLSAARVAVAMEWGHYLPRLGAFAFSLYRLTTVENASNREWPTPAHPKSFVAEAAYVVIAMLDYSVQISSTLKKLRSADVVLFDRYVLDLTTFLSMQLGKDHTGQVELTRLFYRVIPPPRIQVVVDVPADIALSRRDPERGLVRTKESIKRYLEMSKDLDAVIVSGTDTLASNVERLTLQILAEVRARDE